MLDRGPDDVGQEVRNLAEGPEIAQESASSPVPVHLMSLTGPYLGGFWMTAGGCFSTGGGPYIRRACQSAWTYLLVVSVRPTATPPTLTTLFAQSSRYFSVSDLYAVANSSAPQPAPADWLYWFSTSTSALAPLSYSNCPSRTTSAV